MKKIYTYGHSLEERLLTIHDMRVNKAAGRKMTQVTAKNTSEAEIIADQGIDMIITGSDWYPDVRKGAPNTFITAALFAGRYITNEEILAGAIGAATKGADSVLTSRSLDAVEAIANQGIAVQGHVGMVPSQSIKLGGMRTVGKTADEAIAVLDDMRRLEDAGAFGCEIECVAQDALEVISEHTTLITNSIGAGSFGDVMFLFFEDICGESENPPRHAEAWGDGAAIRRQLDQERRKAINGFKEAVASGAYPSDRNTVSMSPDEKDKLLEALDKRS